MNPRCANAVARPRPAPIPERYCRKRTRYACSATCPTSPSPTAWPNKITSRQSLLNPRNSSHGGPRVPRGHRVWQIRLCCRKRFKQDARNEASNSSSASRVVIPPAASERLGPTARRAREPASPAFRGFNLILAAAPRPAPRCRDIYVTRPPGLTQPALPTCGGRKNGIYALPRGLASLAAPLGTGRGGAGRGRVEQAATVHVVWRPGATCSAAASWRIPQSHPRAARTPNHHPRHAAAAARSE